MTHGISSERPRRGGRGRKSQKPAQATSLFSSEGRGGAEEGRRRRDEGAKRAEHGATALSRRAGEEGIRRLARERDTFTSDDLHDLLETEGAPTLESKLVGALFLHASRRGEIEAVGWATSTRPSRNSGPVRVWTRGSS